MALEDIFRALEEQADADVEAVLAEARAHATAIARGGGARGRAHARRTAWRMPSAPRSCAARRT